MVSTAHAANTSHWWSHTTSISPGTNMYIPSTNTPVTQDTIDIAATSDTTYTPTGAPPHLVAMRPESLQSNVERSITMQIVFTVIGCCGCPSNALVIWVVLGSRRMRRKPFNILILHQALVDLLLCMTVVLTQFYNSIDDLKSSDQRNKRDGDDVHLLGKTDAAGPNVLGPTATNITTVGGGVGGGVHQYGVGAELYCRVWVVLSLLWTFISLSVNNLTVITIERYQAVMNPLQYNEHQVKKRLPAVFAAIWILSFVIMLPDYLMSGIRAGHCDLYVYDSPSVGMAVFVFWLFTFLIIPTAVMVTLYSLILIFIKKKTKGRAPGCKKDPSNGDVKLRLTGSVKRTQTMKRAQTNLLQTCIILCFFFFCTMAFAFIADALIIFGVLKGEFSNNLWNAAFISIVVNSCLNPFVYTIRYREFRSELKKSFSLDRFKESVSEMNSSFVPSG